MGTGTLMNDKPTNAIVEFRAQVEQRHDEFAKGLPSHIPAERFTRVVLTAVAQNPRLLKADRASLFTACMRAATDGLLPDGRDGALVTYSTKIGDQWVD